MPPLHRALVDSVRTEATAFLTRDGQAIPTDEQIARTMFSNFRRGGGLALTRRGLAWLQNQFCAFTVDLPPDRPLTGANLLLLETTATMPYYAEARRLITFDQSLAATVALMGDLDTFGRSSGRH